MGRILAYNLAICLHLVVAILLALAPRQEVPELGIDLAVEWASEPVGQLTQPAIQVGEPTAGRAGGGRPAPATEQSPREVVMLAVKAFQAGQRQTAIVFFTEKAQGLMAEDLADANGMKGVTVGEQEIKGDIASVAILGQDSDTGLQMVLQRTARGWRIRGISFDLVDERREFSLETAMWLEPDSKLANPVTPVALAAGSPRQVMVVLDCSQSMNRTVALPGGRQATRLEIAAGALDQELGRLAAKKRRVGVMLYGHRVGWRPGTMTLLQQQGWARKIPQGLKPYEDVELIQPPGVYTPADHRALMNLLRSGRPWGESPQNLALLTAIKQLQPGDRIVLITDGPNLVYQPPNNMNPQDIDVLAAAKESQVTIDAVVLE